MKELYKCEKEGDIKVTSVSLAGRLEVRPASVADMFSKLEGKELIDHRRWRYVKLSPKGLVIAESLIWRHRILETYFSSILKLNFSEACDAASLIDSSVTSSVVEAMCRTLGHPTRCVHGYHIPHPEV